MSQRHSGYERKPHDQYDTPEWVTEALIPHIPGRITSIWEPACGKGQMSKVLGSRWPVIATDIQRGIDFLEQKELLGEVNAIITNPPYGLGPQFIEHALELLRPVRGFVAMLFKIDYDHAKTRQHLFRDCPIFSKQVVLTKRIVWFQREDGKRPGPSENHAWFCWDWEHQGPAVKAYGP